MGTEKRSLQKALVPLAAAGALLAWGLGRPHAEAAPPKATVQTKTSTTTKTTTTKASAPGALPPLCDLSKPPNLGAIAKAIAPTNKQFVSDYNLLSQASWCTFIALNWPAQGTAPTMTADPSQKFGTSGATEVWETWEDSTEVYCANGSAPGQCGGTLMRTAAGRKIHRLKTANPNSSHFLDARIQAFKSKSPRLLAAAAGQDQDLSEDVQATGFMLPDKNNTPSNPSIVLYEVRENPSFVQFLTKMGLYNRNGQTLVYNQQGGKAEPPGKTPIDFPGSAFEVKPSWYVIPQGEQDPMYISQGTCSPGVQCGTDGTINIGLTGIHVLWKVFPHSSWIWMTFEYNDNPTLTPILNQAVTYTRPGGATCPNGAPLPCPDGPYIAGTPTPSNPVQDGANAANAIYQPMLAGTPFAHYKLVGVQVATMVNGQPTLLANNHIETDFGATNTPNNPSSSCVTCHYYASIGNLNTKNCPSKPANIRRIGIFKTTDPIPNMQAFGSGYTGDGQPGLYNANGSSGPYIGGDFIWTLQLAQWNLAQGNGCPSSTTATTTKKVTTTKAKPAKPPVR